MPKKKKKPAKKPETRSRIVGPVKWEKGTSLICDTRFAIPFPFPAQASSV